MKATTKKPRAKARTFAQKLRLIGACEEAREWAGDRAAQQAWDECENPNWMMWLLSETMPGNASLAIRRRIVRLACDFAKPVLKHVPASEKRPAAAIELAEKWAKGKPVTGAELEEASAASREALAALEAALWAASREALAALEAAQVKLIRKYFPKCPEIKAGQ